MRHAQGWVWCAPLSIWPDGIPRKDTGATSGHIGPRPVALGLLAPHGHIPSAHVSRTADTSSWQRPAPPDAQRATVSGLDAYHAAKTLRQTTIEAALTLRKSGRNPYRQDASRCRIIPRT